MIAVSLLCAAALTGCAAEFSVTAPETQTTTTGTTTTAATTTIATTTAPQHVGALDPLTGEYGMREGAAGKRPVAVMVNNLKGALPQYGIAEADIIYELPVEGGITRLMAVYPDWENVPNVCSVRSCRYYYPIICLGMDAIYCHWGLDQTMAKDVLERTQIDHLDGGYLFGSVFFRDPNRVGVYSSEHTGYMDGAKFAQYVTDHSIRTELGAEYKQPVFRFADEDTPVTPEAQKAAHVILGFSGAYYSTFDYDAASGTYKKQHSGAPHIDQNTGEQLSFENVFILQTDIHLSADGYRMDVALTGGAGWYIANGGAERISWRKDAETAPIRVYHADGSELTVSAGKSYIGIIGAEKAITINAE